MNAELPKARRRWVLVAILALALGLRLLYSDGMSASPGYETPGMDAEYHVEWARSMNAAEDHFLRDRHHPVGEASPYFRAPGYIRFLSWVLRLGGDDLGFVRIVQSLLGTLTTALVYALGRRVFDPLRGLVAAGLAATYWLFLYYDAELLIPTLYLPLNLAALVLLHDGAGAKGKRGWILCTAAGLVFGLAGITRPNVLLVMPFLALWLLWLKLREEGRGPALTATALLTLGTLLPVLPVAAHNARAGDFALVATQGGVNFWIGNNPQSDGSSAIVPGTRANWWGGYFDAIAQAEQSEGRELQPSEVSEHYTGRTFEFITGQTGAWLSLMGRKLAIFWNGYEFGNNQPIAFYAKEFNPWVRWLPVRFPELLALGLLGLVLSRKVGHRSAPLALYLLVYSASVLAFFVCARFRMPVLPILMVFAGHALVWIFERFREKRYEALAFALVPVAISATLSRSSLAGIPADDSMGYWHLGVAEGVRGDGDAAERALRKSIQLEPRNVFARVALGKRLEAKGERKEAKDQLREALRLDGRRVDALDPLLRMLVQDEEWTEAEGLAQYAAGAFPQLATPRHWLGRVRQHQGRSEEALALYQEAVALDGTAYTPFLDLGRLALELRQSRLAAQAFERARQNLGRARWDEAEAVYPLLITVIVQRNRPRALELAREYAQLYPDSRRAQGMLRELQGN